MFFGVAVCSVCEGSKDIESGFGFGIDVFSVFSEGEHRIKSYSKDGWIGVHWNYRVEEGNLGLHSDLDIMGGDQGYG